MLDARQENVRAEVQTQANGPREAAQSIIKNKDQDPHLDLKASQSYWDEINPTEHCTAFGTREYTAKLKNLAWIQNAKWKKVCENTQATIHGVKVKPTKCERKVCDLSALLFWWYVGLTITNCSGHWGRSSGIGL